MIKMRTFKTVGATAMLAIMLPLSAYAAAAEESGGQSRPPVDSAAGHRGGDWPGGIGEEVLELLKLDEEAYRELAGSGQSLAQIAEAQGVSHDSLKAAMTEDFDNRQEERRERYISSLDEAIDRVAPAGKERAKEGGGWLGLKDRLDVAASALGMTAEELKTALSAGTSIADVAEEKGIAADTVVAALSDALTERIRQAADEGKLTEEQAEERLAKVGELASAIVNGQGWKGGGKIGRGHGGERPAAADDRGGAAE